MGLAPTCITATSLRRTVLPSYTPKKILDPAHGFEPQLSESNSDVLPLDEAGINL